MKKQLLLSLALLFGLIHTSYAETKEDIVRDILRLTGTYELSQSMLDRSCEDVGKQYENIQELLDEDLSADGRALSEEILTRMSNRLQASCKQIDVAKLVKKSIPIYVELLSQDELIAYRDALNLPIMKKMIKITPVLMIRSSEAMQPELNRMMKDLIDGLKEDIKNSAETIQSPTV